MDSKVFAGTQRKESMQRLGLGKWVLSFFEAKNMRTGKNGKMAS